VDYHVAMLPSPDVFATPFFRAHPPRTTVEITDHRGAPRSYAFPTLFTQTPATMLMFTADLAATRALLGPAPVSPVRVSPTRCLFAVACYRYGQISDGMVGYNELVLAVPVSASRVPIVPALLRRRWPSFGVYVVDMPVDSEENRNRGVAIWGLPKTMKRFRYHDDLDRRTVEVLDGDARCVRLSVPRGGRRRVVSEMTRVYSRRSGEWVRCQTFMEGACWQYTQLSPLAAGVELELGDGPLYRAIAGLGLSSRPVMVRDFEAMSTALYSPEAL
jgi:hypothetical protein